MFLRLHSWNYDLQFYTFYIATELSSDQGEGPMHRPLKDESQSVAKMRAEHRVGPTYDQYVYSPSKLMRDPGVEKPNTLGIELQCLITYTYPIISPLVFKAGHLRVLYFHIRAVLAIAFLDARTQCPCV